MTLTEFLTARLDEDGAAARAAGLGVWESVADLAACNGPGITSDHGDIVDEWHVDADVAPHIARHDPARVLREVEAKRAIMAARSGLVEPDPVRRAALDFALGQIAAIYADHPDYREEWRP